MTRSALRIILMGSMLALPACHRKASAPAPARSVNADDLSKNKQGEGNGTGAGQGANTDEETADTTSRYHEATVYVDGVPRIAFTYNEMPSTVKVYEYVWSEDYPNDKAHHMLVADYVKSLGIDVAKVKEMHWYGGRDRVVVLTGDELRKYKDKLFFQFTRDMFGKPRTEWRTNVMVNDHIDVVSDLAIYVDKKPPRWDKELWSLVDDRGEPIDKTIPYCQEEMPRRSVRVNVDGRFVAYMKRNLLEGNLHPLNGDKDGNVPAGVLPIYRLNELLSSRKQPASGFKGIDLITGEERIVRLSADEAKDLTFSLKRHGGGVAEIFWQGHTVEAKAVNVYVGTPVPTRPHRTLTLGHQARIGGGDSHSRQEKAQ